MQKSIKVSILIPIYKVERYLEKCLDSVFTQTYQNVDYVFVNDCSPDNSLQVLKDTICKHGIDKNRYVIIDHEQNEGIAVSRADCIKHATGDYVLFVDSDDWIEDNAVEQMILATKNGSIDIVGCDYIDEFGSGKKAYHKETYAETCQENLVRCLNYDVSPVLWKLLIKRSLFENIKITPGLNIGEDYSISIKLYYYAKSFQALNQAFYHYVHYNQSKLSYQRLRSVNDHVSIVNEVETFMKEKGIYYDEAAHRLQLRKFNIKSNFLTKQLWDLEAYNTVFPEAKGVWRQMPYTRKEKMKFWLAENRLYSPFKIIYTIFNLK